MRRGLFTLEVKDAGAKSVLDETYREDLEELIREVTGSPVRVRTQLASDAPAPAPAPMAASSTSKHQPAVGHSRFVVTAASAFAHAAVERMVEDGRGFTPLFVHGPPGCGKTALAAHALSRLSEQPGASEPLILSGEALSIDVGRAARDGSFGAMQRGWAGRDVIVLDEAHRLRNRKTTQAIVVSLIAPAVERGARVLILSRHPPDAIYALGERLRSHFLSGFLAPMKQPDCEARREVLAGAAAELDLIVAPEVPAELARRCPGTLVDAMAVLRRAAAACRGGVLDLDALGEGLVAPTRSELMLGRLVELVSEETGLDADRIRSREKSRPVASARHLCVYVASRSLGLSSRQICRSLRQSSPSIVAYARRKVERRRSQEPAFDELVLRLQSRLDGAQRDFAWRA